jgi:hypothetical protein
MEGMVIKNDSSDKVKARMVNFDSSTLSLVVLLIMQIKLSMMMFFMNFMKIIYATVSILSSKEALE